MAYVYNSAEHEQAANDPRIPGPIVMLRKMKPNDANDAANDALTKLAYLRLDCVFDDVSPNWHPENNPAKSLFKGNDTREKYRYAPDNRVKDIDFKRLPLYTADPFEGGEYQEPPEGVRLDDRNVIAAIVKNVPGRKRYNKWPYDFDSNAKVRPERTPSGNPVIHWTNGVPYVIVIDGWYALVGGRAKVQYIIDAPKAGRSKTFSVGLAIPAADSLPPTLDCMTECTRQTLWPQYQHPLVAAIHEPTVWLRPTSPALIFAWQLRGWSVRIRGDDPLDFVPDDDDSDCNSVRLNDVARCFQKPWLEANTTLKYDDVTIKPEDNRAVALTDNALKWELTPDEIAALTGHLKTRKDNDDGDDRPRKKARHNLKGTKTINTTKDTEDTKDVKGTKATSTTKDLTPATDLSRVTIAANDLKDLESLLLTSVDDSSLPEALDSIKASRNVLDDYYEVLSRPQATEGLQAMAKAIDHLPAFQSDCHALQLRIDNESNPAVRRMYTRRLKEAIGNAWLNNKWMFLAANAGGNAAEDQHLRNMLVNFFGTKVANKVTETRNAGTQTDADDRDTPGGDDDTLFGARTTDSSYDAGVDEIVDNAETHTDADVDKDNGDESPFTGFDYDME